MLPLVEAQPFRKDSISFVYEEVLYDPVMTRSQGKPDQC
jgi:hypothetical protein